MLILTSITGFNTVFAEPTNGITIEDWDLYATGVGSGSGAYVTWGRTNDSAFYSFNVTDDWNYSGTKSLNADVLESGGGIKENYYGNISLDQVWDYIYQIKIYFRIKQYTYSQASTQVRFEFFNLTNDRVLKVVFSESTGEGTHPVFNGVGVYDFEDVLNICPASTSYSDWTELVLVITHLEDPVDKNLMRYEVYNITGFYQYGFIETSNVVNPWTNFSYLKFYGLAYSGSFSYAYTNLRIDDIILYTEAEEEEPEYGDVSEWSYVGNIDYPIPLFEFAGLIAKAKYLEEKRFVKMSCDVKAVDLLVSTGLYNENPDLTKYYLKINGHPMGIPSYWVPYNDNYLLRWIGFTESLDNEEPVLEFHHSEPAYGYMYWYGIAHSQGHYLYDDDVDNDGETSFRYHSNSNQFNGLYDGVLYNADLIYRMYYIGELYPPPRPYDDIIDTDKNSYEQYEPVVIAGSVSDILHINRLVVNKSGVEYINKTISGHTFQETFTPKLEGTYNASIWRKGNGIVKTCSFTVTITSLEHYIYTEPHPSKPLESFTVYFKYNYTTLNCSIVLVNNENILKPLKIWKYNTVPIEDSFSYILNTEGIYYFDLCSYYFDDSTNEYVYTTIKRHKHVCKNEYANQINVVYDTIELEKGGQLVYGSHNFLGSNVVIRMNNEVAFNIGDVSEFNVPYFPQYSGEYNASLVLVLSDTNLVLDYTFFSVSGDLPIPPPPDDIFGLPIEYMNAMFGAFITLGFLIIPFALSIKSRHETSSVIYAIFGGIGLGVATIAGLFPIWLPFMICVIMIGVLIIEYKKR